MVDSRNLKRRRKKSNASYILEIFLCLVAITGIVFAIIFLIRFHAEEKRADELQAKLDIYEDPEDPLIKSSEAMAQIDSAKEDIYSDAYSKGRTDLLDELKNSILNTDSVLHTVMDLYPDDLIINYEGRYLFFPILEELKKNPYNREYYSTLDNGRIIYTDSGVNCETWIDVSKFQGKILWNEVASDGIDGAVIRMGYRGYSVGDIVDDDTFEDNIKGALKNDIKVGVYFLSQAVSDEEALEEAKYVIDNLKAYNISGPVVLDIELVGGEDGRGNSLSMSERTDYSITFLDALSEAGYDVMIYGNLRSYLIMLDIERLEDYPKWFAYYEDTPYWPYDMSMWQYTEKGSVDGIKGDVDLNILFTE